MKANMALYDFKDNEKDFMNNLVFIPDYLSWLINKISPTALSSTDSIVNFIFNSVFHSGFIGVKENEVLVGPYQINKLIPLNKNYIERNTVKIKKELLKLLENELNQTDSYHQKYLKYKNKYLQLKKQISSI
jgi:hypothetical protein